MRETHIESYCFFEEEKEFTPMFNPNQMLDYGIGEGVIIHTTWGIGSKVRDVIDSWITEHEFIKGVRPDKIFGGVPALIHNHYKTLATEPPPMHYQDRFISIKYPKWLEWYFRFYFGERKQENNAQMIAWWKHVVLWGMDEAPKDHNTDQMLLEYSWNPGWAPTLLK